MKCGNKEFKRENTAKQRHERVREIEEKRII